MSGSPGPNVSAVAPDNYPSAALEASHVVKATAGVVFGFTVANTKASAQFIQFHDATSLPADTAIPATVFTVPASSSLAVDFGMRGMRFDHGIVICNSSTSATKTIGSADCFFAVRAM